MVNSFVATKIARLSSCDVRTGTKTIARTTTFSLWPRLIVEGSTEKRRQDFSSLCCHPTPSEEQMGISSNDGFGGCNECVPSQPHPNTSVLCSSSDPITMNDLSDENIVKIVRMECTDADANILAWRCLGYVYDENTRSWDATAVFPKW